MWPLLNLVFLQSGLQEICCFLECHPTCQFRISFLPVLYVIYCALYAQNRGKPLCKTTLQYTVIHTPHSPTVSWIQITREARNSEYLLNVNNTLQKYINLIPVPWLLFDMPLAANSLSLLYQWPVTSWALKPVTSFPPWRDVRHNTVQEIPFHRSSREITMSKEAFQKFQSWIQLIQSKTSI